MSSVEIDHLGEGRSDSVIARALIEAVGARPGRDYSHSRRTGKDALDRRAGGLNTGAAFGNPVLILRDLDSEICAGGLVARLLPGRNPRCSLRIAVPSAESWLMADRDAYAAFCGLRVGAVPEAPETVGALKPLILGWGDGEATKLARHMAEARRRGVPAWQSLGEWHAAFAGSDWSPARAAKSGRAPSLARALIRLKEMTAAERGG